MASPAVTTAGLYNYTFTDVVVNKTVCATPGAMLVASFTVSSDLQKTEKLMVATSVLMTILGGALLLVGLLGRFSGRHKAHSTPTRIFFRASFALFLPFMSYMFSQAKSKGVEARAELILLWMLLVELLRKKVYAMVAPAGDAFARGVGRYTFFDNVEQAARMAWIGYLIYSYVHGFGAKSFFIMLWLFSVVKLIKRMICIEFAKKSFDVGRNARLVSGYMAQLVKHNQQHEPLEPGDTKHILSKCNYVVMGESKLKRVERPQGYRFRYLKHILSGKPAEEIAQKAKNKAKAAMGRKSVADAAKVAEEAEKEAKAAMEAGKELVRVSTIWELAEADRMFRYCKKYRRKLEDICLGLALFKLLRRRFEEHYPVAEARTLQARELVVQGLLSLNGNNNAREDSGTDQARGLLSLIGDNNARENAERAFDVAELELTFLEEYYQAVIPIALPKPWLFFANFSFSILFVLAYCVTVLLVTGNGAIFRVLGSIFGGLVGLSIDMVVQYNCLRHQVSFLVSMVFNSSDLIVTFLLLLTLLAVETYEFSIYLLSDWFAASILCSYARRPGLQERRAARHAVSAILWFKARSSSEIRAHQESMLRLQPRRIWKLATRVLKRRLVGRSRAVVTTEAKVAIVAAIKARAKGNLSNGAESLRRNKYDQLVWACEGRPCAKPSAAEVILVWHVATSLFKARHPAGKCQLPPTGQAAVTLSRYCAYLVGYEPDLLPDDPMWTEKAYNDMRQELYSFFRNCGSTASRRTRLLQLQVGDDTPMMKGAWLGKLLEDAAATMEDEENVWTMLAEFWAELLVFVAPVGIAPAHALALAHGSELITCVWAMLMHAGIGDDGPHHQPAQPSLV